VSVRRKRRKERRRKERRRKERKGKERRRKERRRKERRPRLACGHMSCRHRALGLTWSDSHGQPTRGGGVDSWRCSHGTGVGRKVHAGQDLRVPGLYFNLG
jgi:hypothetical protein